MTRLVSMIMALAMALLVTTATGGLAQEVPRMTVEDLRERLQQPGLTVIDVRTGRDWTGSPVKIPGAVREEPGRIDWESKYDRGQTLVLYCT
jgi:3-mercaptopyruvate sulfurtransferase SseA